MRRKIGWALLTFAAILGLVVVGLMYATIWFTHGQKDSLGQNLSDTGFVTSIVAVAVGFAGCVCEPWNEDS